MNVGDVSQDPQAPTPHHLPVDCGPTAWCLGLPVILRNAAGSLPQSATLHIPCSQCSLECRLRVPSTLAGQHPQGHRWPQSTCAGSFPAAPISQPQKGIQEPIQLHEQGVVNSEALNLQVLCGLKDTSLAGVKVERPRLYYLPSVSSCSGMRQQKQRGSTAWTTQETSPARSQPWAEHPSPRAAGSQNRAAVRPLSRSRPPSGHWAPRLAAHWRLSSNGIVLPLCYFLFYICKKIYKQRYQLAAVDIIITTCKWWHSPSSGSHSTVNIHPFLPVCTVLGNTCHTESARLVEFMSRSAVSDTFSLSLWWQIFPFTAWLKYMYHTS